MKPRITIIEDDGQWAEILAKQLRGSYEPILARTGASGLKILEEDNTNCTILDLGLPDYKNEEELPLLKFLLDKYPEIPVIILTGRDDTSLAVKAARLGAFDYVSKRIFDTDKFLTTVRNAVGWNLVHQRFRETIQDELAAYPLLGQSQEIVRIREMIKKVAAVNDPVLITGESGTGKEIVARHLHWHSKRYSHKFVITTVPGRTGPMAYSELFGHVKGAFTGATANKLGRFQLADGGTLFLDDVDLCPPDVQAMLLRVLEDGKAVRLGSNDEQSVDVRVIAASNKDLKSLSQSGDFREDLYYRLSCIKINISPLRERPGDIGLLARYFLETDAAEDSLTTAASQKFSEDAFEVLKSYDWPGNVRELKHVVRSLYLFTESDVIDADDVAIILGVTREKTEKPGTFKESIRAFQREFVARKLHENGNNISQTARELAISRQHLQNLIKNLGIKEA
jgi:DNA-binding NtrC family response regulator